MEKIQRRLLWANWMTMAMVAAVAIGIAVFFRKSLPPEIPLYYSRPWGQDQLAKPGEILIPLGLALGVGLISGGLGNKWKNEPIMPVIGLSVSIFFQWILMLGVIRIIILMA